MVMAEPDDGVLLNLIPELRDCCPAKRIALQLIGGNADQVENRILEKADLVLASEADESTFLKELDDLFSPGPTP